MSHQPGVDAREGFTLVELLIVVAIIAVLLGMTFSLPKRLTTEEAVRGSAEELATVFRETRARAMKQNTTYAVAFNICNAPGSSGKILNNRGGGHWYRVIGPNDAMWDQTHGELPEYGYHTLPFPSGLNPVSGIQLYNTPAFTAYLNLISRSWVDEPHYLPRGQVRFLALTDQDNGNDMMPAAGGWYSPTYPRPWFGWWDATTKNLNTWGGYDPSIVFGDMHTATGPPLWSYINVPVSIGGRIASPSGFYYEGYEGPITGCVNPADRVIADDDPSDTHGTPGQLGDAGDAGKYFTLSRKDEPRPLINANWLDYVIIFRSDGTVTDDWFRYREFWYWESKAMYWRQNANPYVATWPTKDLRDEGIGDRCSGMKDFLNTLDQGSDDPRFSPAQREATTYVDRTGYYWITLAGDAADDSSQFPTAELALRSMLPIFRVGVSPNGSVRLLRVANTYNGPNTFDANFMDAGWQNKQLLWGKAISTWNASTPVTTVNYINHRPNDASGRPIDLPVFDVVTPYMLQHRAWWWKYP